MTGDLDEKLKGARSGELGWSPSLKKGLERYHRLITPTLFPFGPLVCGAESFKADISGVLMETNFCWSLKGVVYTTYIT